MPTLSHTDPQTNSFAMTANPILRELHRQCLWCSMGYHSESHPHWAIDRSLLIVGTVHPAHAALWRRQLRLPSYHTFSPMLSPYEAHRTAWWRRRAATLGLRTNLFITTLFRLPDQRKRLLRQWEQQRHGATSEQRQEMLTEAEKADAEYRRQYPTDDHIFARRVREQIGATRRYA